MNIFVTGATGWVGFAVVQELIASGHHVTGLARSDEKAATLAATGAKVLRATLEELDALHQAASAADAVVHTAFDHDFSRFTANCEQDRRVIEVLGSALEGSDRPLLVTSGLLGLACGASESDLPDPRFAPKIRSGCPCPGGAGRPCGNGSPRAVGSRPRRLRLHSAPHPSGAGQRHLSLLQRDSELLGRRPPAGCRARLPARAGAGCDRSGLSRSG